MGFLLIFAGFAVFLRAGSFAVFALAWVVFGVGGGFLGPAYQSLISKVVPRHLLGTFTGVFRSSAGFLALPAHPGSGPSCGSASARGLPFLITAVTSLLVLPPIWLKFRAPHRETGVSGRTEAPPADEI